MHRTRRAGLRAACCVKTIGIPLIYVQVDILPVGYVLHGLRYSRVGASQTTPLPTCDCDGDRKPELWLRMSMHGYAWLRMVTKQLRQPPERAPLYRCDVHAEVHTEPAQHSSKRQENVIEHHHHHLANRIIQTLVYYTRSCR